jgi:fluoroquinolone transport system permease protein
VTGRLVTVTLHDARLQLRYGIYAAYAVVVAVYVGLLFWLGPWLPDWAAAFIIFSDPAALGFFFLGALMMLERSEGVRSALATAPIRVGDYLGGKMITLTALALVASTILHIASMRSGNAALLAATVILTSIQYIGIGVPIARRFKTVSGYLMGSAGFMTPAIAPAFLALLDPFPIWIAVVPAVSQFRLMLVATGAADAGISEIALLLAVAIAAAFVGLLLAYRSLRLEFGR